MRLWHQTLIHYLPRQQLLGQHRECCALRGKGWRKKHSVVDYVFKYDPALLYNYHLRVMQEMTDRGYHITNSGWYSRSYRGKNTNDWTISECGTYVARKSTIIYPEHDDKYLKECLLNLQVKGAELVNGTSIAEMLLKLVLKTGI